MIPSRFLLLIALLGLVSLLPGCADGEEELDAESYRARGDAAFTAADQLMARWGSEGLPGTAGDPTTLREEAVRAYLDSANDLIRAFRMEDPEPERRHHRAMLAFRIGRALSNASRHGVTHPYRDSLGKRAVFWFGEATSLEPTLHFATFEQAVLFESEILSIRDFVRARDAYASFLTSTAEAAAGETTIRLRERATERQAELEKILRPIAGD